MYIFFLIPVFFRKAELSYFSFLKTHLIKCSILYQIDIILYSLYRLCKGIDYQIIVIISSFLLTPILNNFTFIAIESFLY